MPGSPPRLSGSARDGFLFPSPLSGSRRSCSRRLACARRVPSCRRRLLSFHSRLTSFLTGPWSISLRNRSARDAGAIIFRRKPSVPHPSRNERSLSDLDERHLRRLFARSGQADYELDLTGLDCTHALASIERMVERQRFREEPRTVVVRLDPATATSGETLPPAADHRGRRLLHRDARPGRGRPGRVTATMLRTRDPVSAGRRCPVLVPEGLLRHGARIQKWRISPVDWAS